MSAHLWDALKSEHEAAHVAVQALTDASDLAEAHEELAEEERRARAALKRLTDAKAECTARLENALGDGEAVRAPSGRVFYLGPRSGGCTVRTQAVEELAGELPELLRPRDERRYPGVTAIRDALRRGEITRETHDLLLDEQPPRMGLRWRSLDVEAAA